MVLELSPELSPSTLDRTVADAPDVAQASPVAAESVLSQVGLVARVVDTGRPVAQVEPGTVMLGLGSQDIVVLSASSRSRFGAVVIEDDGTTTIRRRLSRRRLRRWLTRREPDLTWLHVTRRGGLSSLARPGGSMGPWRRLFGLARLERRDIAAVGIYAASVGALTLVAPIATQTLVNTIAFGTVLQPLIVLSLALLIGLSLAGSLSVIQAYIIEVFQRRVLVRVAEDFCDRLPMVAASKRDRRDLVELNNRFFDVITVQKASATLLLSGLGLLLQITVGMILLGVYHPVLLAFDLVLLASMVLVLQAGRGATATAVAESKSKLDIAAWLDEIARTPHQFMGGHGRLVAAEKLSHRVRGYLRARGSHFRRVFSVLVGGIAIQVISIVALLGIGGWLVIERQLTLGQLVAAEIVVGAIAVGVGKFGKLAEKTFDLVAAVDKIGEVLDLPQRDPGSDPLPIGEQHGVLVTASRLQVGYANNPVMGPASFELQPGEKRIVEAATGSGRSALLETLAGWRKPISGTVRWDGHSRPRADDISQRAHLARASNIFGGTLFSNLRQADSTLSTSRAWDALARVGLSDALDRLPFGLDTELLPNGSPLSGSQLRRLALARALIARPGLLLIDEALDFITDDEDELAQICEELIGAKAPWTTLVVTNDPRVRRFIRGRLRVPRTNEEGVR